MGSREFGSGRGGREGRHDRSKGALRIRGRESTERTEDTGEGEFNNAIGYQAIGHPIISRRERNRVHPMMTSPGPGFLCAWRKGWLSEVPGPCWCEKTHWADHFLCWKRLRTGKGPLPPPFSALVGVGMGRKGKWWVDAQAHLSTATKNLAVC